MQHESNDGERLEAFKNVFIEFARALRIAKAEHNRPQKFMKIKFNFHTFTLSSMRKKACIIQFTGDTHVV